LDAPLPLMPGAVAPFAPPLHAIACHYDGKLEKARSQYNLNLFYYTATFFANGESGFFFATSTY